MVPDEPLVTGDIDGIEVVSFDESTGLGIGTDLISVLNFSIEVI